MKIKITRKIGKKKKAMYRTEIDEDSEPNKSK